MTSLIHDHTCSVDCGPQLTREWWCPTLNQWQPCPNGTPHATSRRIQIQNHVLRETTDQPRCDFCRGRLDLAVIRRFFFWRRTAYICYQCDGWEQ